MTTSGDRIQRIIEQYDGAIAGAEDAVIRRVAAALDSAYSRMEKELLRAYDKHRGNLDLLPNQRKLLILQELGTYRQLLSSVERSQIESDFETLILGSYEGGLQMSGALVRAIANEPIQSFAAVNLAAVRFQAQDASSRLYRWEPQMQDKISAVVEAHLAIGAGPRKVASQLRRELGIVKGRAEAIARTESMSAHNSAAKANYQRAGIDQIQLIATQDNRICSHCSSRAGNVYEINEISVPLHPLCRCYALPYRQEWAELGLVDTAWWENHQAEVQAQATPNPGVAPFEKMAGLTKPPKPVATVADIKQAAAAGPKPKAKSEPKQSSVASPKRAVIDTIRLDGLEKAWDATEPLTPEWDAAREAFFAERDRVEKLRKQEQEKVLAAIEPSMNREQISRDGAHKDLIQKGVETVGTDLVKKMEAALAGEKYAKKVEALKAQIAKLNPEFDRLFDIDMSAAFKSDVGAQLGKLGKELADLQDIVKSRKEALKVMEEIRGELLKGMSREEARAIADEITILKSATKGELKEEDIRNEMTDFFQITGGRGKEYLDKIKRTESRAYAALNKGYVNIGGGYMPRQTLWHEMGHFVESENDSLVKLNESWVKARATSTEQESLAKMTGDSGYDEYEMAYPDHFSNPYVGKVYGDASEVLSMGIQHFTSPEYMLRLYLEDREHFWLTIGALRA